MRLSLTSSCRGRLTHLVYDLVGHGYDLLASLPEHHEALQPVHNAGQPHRVPLVDDHVGALRGKGGGGEVLYRVAVGVIFNLLVVCLIVVVRVLFVRKALTQYIQLS